MKKIYFVRHGESEGNKHNIRQNIHTSLTERGREQANFLAERCRKLPIHALICSTMVRARETAHSILEKVDIPIEYSELFVERRRPSEVQGKSKSDPYIRELEKEIRNNFGKEGWRYSDEENFHDLKKRGNDALKYLEQYSEDEILVVTHGYFLRILAACVMFGEELNSREFLASLDALNMENTGITIFTYDDKQPHPWKVWVWNDHAHLG